MSTDTEIIRRKWKRNRILWTHGLIAAIILGVAHSVPPVLVAPETFNLHEGLSKLGMVAIASGLLGAFTYLSKSPLPQLPKELEEEITIDQTITITPKDKKAE